MFQNVSLNIRKLSKRHSDRLVLSLRSVNYSNDTENKEPPEDAAAALKRKEDGTPSFDNQGDHTYTDTFNKLLFSMKDDFRALMYFLKDPTKRSFHRTPIFPRQADLLIIGGGPIGSAIAYFVKERARKGMSIVVVDKDMAKNDERMDSLSYEEATMLLSMSGLTHQFSVRQNIQLGLYGAEFLRRIKRDLKIGDLPPPNVAYFPFGYLTLATAEGAEKLKERHVTQQYLGAKGELLTKYQLNQRYPWLNTEDIEVGSHGLQSEGWFDAWGLTHALRAKAISIGADYVDGEVEKLIFERPNDMIVEGYSPGEYEAVNDAIIRLPNGDKKTIEFGFCIVAAGADTGRICRDLLDIKRNNFGYRGYEVPLAERRRFVYRFISPNGPGICTPLVVDPSGVYVRRDGVTDSYICGRIPPIELKPEADNFMTDREYFDKYVWFPLAKRIPAFETIKLQNSCSLRVDYNAYDQNGIFGLHPAYVNVFIASGFGLNGVPFAPGIGRAVAEYFIDNSYMDIDMRPYSFDRFVTNEPLHEEIIV